MFNRTYQIRSRRGGLVSAGDVIQELVERAAVRQTFHRPAQRPKPGAARKLARKPAGGKLQGVQLELDFVEKPRAVENPTQQPLADLFPEAYE